MTNELNLTLPESGEPGALPTRPRLLLVDDQPLNIQVLYHVFRSDCDVFMATGGVQALEFCRRELPDLILLDVVMPTMDGLEVCRQLKADAATRDIPIIFVTAQEAPADETRALDAGAVDFISKPVNPKVVRARVRTHLLLKAQSDRLRAMAFIDGLTGVANRRRFDDALGLEWRRCQRNHSSLALAMIDIDHFKTYNDSYGHVSGDACLQRVAHCLASRLGRSHDLVARYGGEEFVCLLPEIDTAGALCKAEEMRQAVLALNLPHCASSAGATVSISVGVAATTPTGDNTPESLVSAADAQLYRAKHQGRNLVAG